MNRENRTAERFEYRCFSFLQLFAGQFLRHHTVATLSQLITYKLAFLGEVRGCFGEVDKLLWTSVGNSLVARLSDSFTTASKVEMSRRAGATWSSSVDLLPVPRRD